MTICETLLLHPYFFLVVTSWFSQILALYTNIFGLLHNFGMVSRNIQIVGGFYYLFGELGPSCCTLKWCYLPDKAVLNAQMANSV